jgi:acyl carrier protein
MDRGQVFAELRQHMAITLEVDETSITEDQLLVDDLDADSIDLLQLILALKDQFSISVRDGEVKLLLAELARFLPDQVGDGDQLSDAQLAEVTRRLKVGTIVDFVLERLPSGPA